MRDVLKIRKKLLKLKKRRSILRQHHSDLSRLGIYRRPNPAKDHYLDRIAELDAKIDILKWVLK